MNDECRTKKAFKYVKRILPLFRVVVKFCSTNRLLAKNKELYRTKHWARFLIE